MYGNLYIFIFKRFVLYVYYKGINWSMMNDNNCENKLLIIENYNKKKQKIKLQWLFIGMRVRNIFVAWQFFAGDKIFPHFQLLSKCPDIFPSVQDHMWHYTGSNYSSQIRRNRQAVLYCFLLMSQFCMCSCNLRKLRNCKRSY